jgi:hypothetical protein
MASDQLLTKNIGEEFTCVGQWWLPRGRDPRNPKLKYGGTLSFSRDEGITLEIMGRLEADKPTENLIGSSPEMIWGVSITGEFITLLGCQSIGLTMGSVWSESYIVTRLFVSNNAWLTPGEDIRFTRFFLDYNYLAEWVGKSGFPVPDFDRYDNLLKTKQVEIFYQRPPDLPPVNVSDYAISIRFGNNWPSVGPAVQEATIKQNTTIVIEPRDLKHISLDKALILARGIQNFLSLVMYPNPVYPLVIEGETKLDGKSKKTSLTTMRLLYKPTWTKKPSEKITRLDIIFSYDDVVDILEGALNKMVTLEDGELESSFNEFFSEYFSPSEFVEDRSIGMLRALEIFQRRTRDNDYYMPKDEYREKLQNKLNEQIDSALQNGDITEEFNKNLKKRLNFAYQHSLSARLNDLLTAYGTLFLSLFVGKKKDQFIRELVATYCWFMHFNPECQNERLETKELALLDLRLELFMVALLLQYAGLRAENIDEIYKLHKFSYLRAN